MPPPPPTSTLFPYTTLFRSQRIGLLLKVALQLLLNVELNIMPRTIRPKQDRKSTRLNSSHVAISYAVFCLKKKKNIPIETRQTERTLLRARRPRQPARRDAR